MDSLGQSVLWRSGHLIEQTVYEEDEGMIRPEVEVDHWMGRFQGSLETTFLEVNSFLILFTK
jgi:hypothetical protein